MKYTLFIIILLGSVLILASCSKSSQELPERSKAASLYSAKYTQDTILLRTDLLWHNRVSGRDLDSVRAAKDIWFLNCNTLLIEHIYYVIDP